MRTGQVLSSESKSTAESRTAELPTSHSRPPLLLTPSLLVTLKPTWLLPILLVLLASLFYLVNLDALSVRGEESRRGRIAWEMVHTGDWIIPRIQGEPRLTRPPFSFWMISLASTLTGDVDINATRLPSALFTIIAVLFLYAYVSRLTSPFVGFLAGFIFMTLGQVLQLGRLGETEAIFTTLMAAALLTTHLALRPGRTHVNSTFSNMALPLTAGLLAGCAFLTKGLQAPIYLTGTITLYTLWLAFSRQLSRQELLSRTMPQALLITLGFSGSVLVWLIPFAWTLGLDGLHEIAFGEVSKHTTIFQPLKYAAHLSTFPIELLLACLCPWSFLLPAFFDRNFRTALVPHTDAARQRLDMLLYSTIAFAVALPTVWLSPNGNTRYLMPLYPCCAIIFAVIAALIIERPSLHYLWRRFTKILPLFMLACTLVAIAWTTYEFTRHATLNPVALLLILLAPPLIFYTARLRAEIHQTAVLNQLIFASLFFMLLINSTALGILNHKQSPARAEVAHIKARLPHPEQLVSLGPTHHLFTFFYAEQLPMVFLPTEPTATLPDFEYFCYHHKGAKTPLPDFPVPWTLIDTVNCDRRVRRTPYDIVLVGKREPQGTSPHVKLAHPQAARWLDPAIIMSSDPVLLSQNDSRISPTPNDERPAPTNQAPSPKP